MTDREMLDLLAAQAPAPAPGFADGMLVRGRRARQRRRLIGWGAGLGVMAVSLVTAGLVAPAATGTVLPGVTVTGAASASSRPEVPEAGAYAAAVAALADQVRSGGPQWPVLYVMDHTCANVVTPTQNDCDPQALPALLRDNLVAALSSYAPVRFVADRSEVTDPDLTIVNGGVLVTLGRIQLQGEQALVPVSVQRNGLNGQGATYQVTRHGDTWQAGDTVGPAWIN
jgi:hypothetical protein